MFNTKGLMSSKRQNWRTPRNLYNWLNKKFKFTFDPCPTFNFLNGLECEWGKVNFVNPPYNQNKEWLKKGYKEYLKGKTVVFLIPARPDTIYWHDYVMKSKEIWFVKGRLKFDDKQNGSAPFPSCIIIFKNHNQKWPKIKGVDKKEWINY